jgi:DNA polymerase II large subunit
MKLSCPKCGAEYRRSPTSRCPKCGNSMAQLELLGRAIYWLVGIGVCVILYVLYMVAK